MGYSVRKSDRSLAKGLRRIARERLGESLALLNRAEPPGPEGLHTLRKNVKKLRALLRLVRPHLDGWRDQDAALRKAGRAIAGIRDRTVMLGLYDALIAEAGLAPSEARALRERLSARLGEGQEGPAVGLAAHRAALEAAAERLTRWRFDAREFELLAPGLEKGVDRARRALKHWRKSRGAEDLHELRKRIKAMGYHSRLLAPIWPEMLEPQGEQLDRLGELLGDARDHALLAGHLTALEAPEAPILVARRKAAALEDQAETLARLVLAEPGEALVWRWRAWWEIWRG